MHFIPKQFHVNKLYVFCLKMLYNVDYVKVLLYIYMLYVFTAVYLLDGLKTLALPLCFGVFFVSIYLIQYRASFHLSFVTWENS